MTAQCFEIQIVGPMRRSEIDDLGKHVTGDELGRWILPPREAEKALDQVTKPFGISADGWLNLLGQIFTGTNQIPWALIALDREYNLAGHLKSIKGLSRDMIFTAYSLSHLRQGEPVKPRFSMLIAFNKEIIGRVAAASPLLASAWDVLNDKAEDKRWLCVSDPLPEAWAHQAEAVDDDVLAEFERHGHGIKQFRG